MHLESSYSESSNSKFLSYVRIIHSRYRLNKRVVFFQLPQFLFDSFDIDVVKNKGYYAYPPTGLQCLKRSLSDRELDIDIVDLNFEILKRIQFDKGFTLGNWLSIVDDYIEIRKPSIIGVSCLSISTDVKTSSFHLTALLRHLRNKEKHVIIAGGTTATNELEYYLENRLCHFVITGEGEYRINFLFDYLYPSKGRVICRPVKGIYFFLEGLEETTGEELRVELKGNLIDVVYEDIPIEEYNLVGSLNPFSRMAGQDKGFSTIQLNRGCRANCKFCGVTDFIGKGLRQYAVSDVLCEIRYLVRNRGIRHFEILDDDFLGKSEFTVHLKELLIGMKKVREEYDITWSAGNGLIAASLDREILSLLRDSGCVGFRVGVESGNEEMLKKIRKPTSLLIIKRLSEIIADFPEMFVDGNYIIGLLGEETFAQILDTFRFARDIRFDWAAFSTFQFTSKITANTEMLQTDNKAATNFIPSKDSSLRIIEEDNGIISGPDIFLLSRDTVPSREQVRQIWFTFNLAANYINNKNILPGGHPKKFVSWLEAIQAGYPKNPYIPLFAAIGNVLTGNDKASKRQLSLAKKNLDASDYWKYRFSQFGLDNIIDNFPCTPDAVYENLAPLQKLYDEI